MSLWDEPNRGRHHYARQLSINNKILWVNRKLDRNDKKNNFIGLETINSNLFVLHTGKSFFPICLPRIIDEFLNVNNILRLRLLLKTIEEYNLNPDLIWIYDYKAVNIASYFKNKCKTLYFCNDFFGKLAERYEFKLAKLVSTVFSTDPRKKKIFTQFNQNSFYVPHGSWPICEKPIFHKKQIPETIGYIGTINDTLDIKIFTLILEQTNFKIIIAGPFSECSNEKKSFFNNYFKNDRVNYLGNLNKEDIYLAIKNIDICLLPYHSKVNGFPLKFFDYLNLGKPIFSTIHDFEWPTEYRKFINFYKPNQDIDSFIHKIYNSWDINFYKPNQDIDSFIHKIYNSWDINFFNEAIILSENSRWSNRVNEIFDKLNLNL
jgi:hypothetical protein